MSTTDTPSTAAEVILISLPPWEELSPHLGIAVLLGFLRQHGVSARALDVSMRLRLSGLEDVTSWRISNSIRWITPESRQEIFGRCYPELCRIARDIIDIDPPILGMSIYGSMQYIAGAVIDCIRSFGYRGVIVVGGPACTAPMERMSIIQACPSPPDVIVVGEGELALLEIVRRVRQHQDLAGVPGVILPGKDPPERKVTPAREVDIRDLPQPDFSSFDIGLYSRLSLEWSRGCINRCAFCEIGPLRGKFKPKTADQIFREIQQISNETGIRGFSICDSALNASPALLQAVCRQLIEQQVEVSWSGSFLARAEMTVDDYRQMRRAGCARIEVGIESGSDNVLKLIRKGTTIAAGEITLQRAHAAGITCVIYLMVGFPGESEEDHLLTIEFIKRNREVIDLVRSVNVCVLQFNTPIVKQAEKFGVVFPTSSHLWGLEWHGPHGNTPEVRRRRQVQLIGVLDELGISFELKAGLDEFAKREKPATCRDAPRW